MARLPASFQPEGRSATRWAVQQHPDLPPLHARPGNEDTLREGLRGPRGAVTSPLTPPDNLITLTLELMCGPSPPPLLARCMTVLLALGLASGGRPWRDVPRAVCAGGGVSPSAGCTCRTLCLKCFSGFTACPGYGTLAPDGTKLGVLG